MSCAIKRLYMTDDCPLRAGWCNSLLSTAILVLGMTGGATHAAEPAIGSVVRGSDSLTIRATVPTGFKHVVLDAGSDVSQPFGEALVSGALDGSESIVTFRIPNVGGAKFLRVRVGTGETVPAAAFSGAPYFVVDSSAGPVTLTEEEKIGHVMSRLTYGPAAGDIQTVRAMGVTAFVEQQLDPVGIDESANTALRTREDALFTTRQPSEDTFLVKVGEVWRYMKGTQAPPADWKAVTFNESAWLEGATGIGYGDDDDATELADMRQAGTVSGYLTVYLRKTFFVGTPGEVDALVLSVDFDDGFVAYLNGMEVARRNVTGNPPLYNSPASADREAGTPEEFDLTTRKNLLVGGNNVLAIELHNVNLTSSDASIIPSLLSRKFLPVPPQKRIRGIEALQELVHVRGIYSKKQLQAVLAEFWENHLTTDYDKVAEYLADLGNSDGQPAMSERQAAEEAAQAEFEEYQFFYDHALGNFGDLLLYSATSPSQLIYLDNVLNIKGAANENYAREILELFAFGVDNRYTQQDIEELARCFTGWGIRKIWPDQKQPFPASSRTPPTENSVQYDEVVLLDKGGGWKYFKGTREPSPAAGGGPSTAWTQSGFDDAAWLPGSTGIGFADNDDATVLSDMRNKYMSVYLRKEFTVGNPSELENLVLSVDYDDGFVAYLNGTEVARSRTMNGTGTPPGFARASNGGREAGTSDSFSLRNQLSLLKPAPEKNILAIQVHNTSLDSSDLSMIPRLVVRNLKPGSIENGDPNGLWTFRFNPAQHDTGAKVVFPGTPHEIRVPAGRTGLDGLKDAVDIVDAMVKHPSTAEFICLKLINKFVSDEITLGSYKDGTAPAELRQLLDAAIAAWNSTTPAGNIRTVLNTLLTPRAPDGLFWTRGTYRSKVKTAVEFINSTARALNLEISGTPLPVRNDMLGMHLFTRDEPDGWSEIGADWIDTGTMLARVQFAQAISADRVEGVRWNFAAWRTANNLSSAESIIEYFNQLLFHGKMSAANKEVLLKFVTTDDLGAPLALDPARANYETRVRELVSLILSMPQWHFQ